jgi:hypothetical protein
LKVAVHQPHYFPYPGLFHKVSLVDKFVLMDDVQYNRGFVNRNRILDVHGAVWLTVPIDKTQKFTENRMVKINNEMDWRGEHWKKLQVSYSNAKFFTAYRSDLERLYSSDWEFLAKLDLETMKLCFGWLGMDVPVIIESGLGVSSTGTQRLIDVCKALGADTYVSGSGGREYMDEALFAKNGLTLEYQHYAPKPYPQRHAGGFVPDLSVIDLLANLGPNSMDFIKSCSVNPGESKDGHSDPKSTEMSSGPAELLEKNAT